MASYGLLEDILLHSRGVGSLGGRGEVGRSPFPILYGSTIADSAVSQSENSPTTVSGFTATAANVDVVQAGGSELSTVAILSQRMQLTVAIIDESGIEDVPLVVLQRKLKTKESTKVDSFEVSREGRPDPIPPSNREEGRWVFTDDTLQ